MSELDIEAPGALERYLVESGKVDAADGPGLSVVPLRGGVSNRTVLVQLPSGARWVVKQALSKLRVPVDWFADPSRIHREALGMEVLGRIAPPLSIVRLLFEDPGNHLLAMEAVQEPFENWKEVLLAGRLDDGEIDQFAHLLAAIHSGGTREIAQSRGREGSLTELADRSLFFSLRVEPYYLYTASRLPEAASFLKALASEVAEAEITIVHGDYSPKNILVHEGRLILLDHEVIHIGDPAFDLGFSLTHLLSKGHRLAKLREGFARAARRYWEGYARAVASEPFAGEGLERRAVRNTLGCLLARVEGRSPLEYLEPSERGHQRRAVVALVERPPARVAEMIERFYEEIGGAHGSD